MLVNHGEIAQFLKPVLAAEINHVDTETDIELVSGSICATESLKEATYGAVGI